jgi:hypothetical protein
MKGIVLLGEVFGASTDLTQEALRDCRLMTRSGNQVRGLEPPHAH